LRCAMSAVFALALQLALFVRLMCLPELGAAACVVVAFGSLGNAGVRPPPRRG